MKFRIRCQGRTVFAEVENNAATTVNDLKATVLQSVCSHLSSDIRLSLNGCTPLEEDSTLSDSGLVHGDTLYVLLPPGAVSDISLSSSSSSQRTDEGVSCSMSSPLSDVSVGANSEQGAKSCSDCHVDSANSEISMACSVADDAFVQPDGAALQTDEEVTDVEINQYLSEPMLIRESTNSSLPQSLIKFYGEVKAPGSLRALAVLLRVLMNELGYLEQDKFATVMAIREWTGTRSLQLNFVYSVLDAAGFGLLLVPMMGTLLIHARAELSNSETVNLKLPLVVSNFVSVDVSDDPCEAFHGAKLPTLSRMFKDTIAYPLLQFALTGSGLCAKPALSTLALELQIAIMKFLDVTSLLRLSEVCHQLHDASQDRSIWRHLFIRDFGVSRISVKDLTPNWKRLYYQKYLENKNLNKYRNYWPPEPIFPPILPIGGEYDINPFYPGPNSPICMGGPVMFPFPNSSSLYTSFDRQLLPSVQPAVRHCHPYSTRGFPHSFRF